MTNVSKLLTLILSIAWPLASSAQSQPPAVVPTFSLLLKAVEDGVKSNHVRIRITLTNKSNHEILIDHDITNKGELTYQVTVRNFENLEPTKSDYHRALKGEPTASPTIVTTKKWDVSVPPGGSMNDTIDVDELYELNIPGKYSIQVQRTDPYTKAVVKSNTITVVITK